MLLISLISSLSTFRLYYSCSPLLCPYSFGPFVPLLLSSPSIRPTLSELQDSAYRKSSAASANLQSTLEPDGRYATARTTPSDIPTVQNRPPCSPLLAESDGIAHH